MEPKTKILEVNDEGLSLQVGNEVFFLDYENYPWFKDAKTNEINNFAYNSKSEDLRWPDLDVDLCLDNFRHPEKYPLRMTSPTKSRD